MASHESRGASTGGKRGSRNADPASASASASTQKSVVIELLTRKLSTLRLCKSRIATK